MSWLTIVPLSQNEILSAVVDDRGRFFHSTKEANRVSGKKDCICGRPSKPFNIKQKSDQNKMSQQAKSANSEQFPATQCEQRKQEILEKLEL